MQEISNPFVFLLTHVLATKHWGQSSGTLKVNCCGADTEPCDAFIEVDALVDALSRELNDNSQKKKDKCVIL